jgi:hypothetical protein
MRLSRKKKMMLYGLSLEKAHTENRDWSTRTKIFGIEFPKTKKSENDSKFTKSIGGLTASS